MKSHPKKMTIQVSGVLPKPFQCECGQKFISHGELKRHEQSCPQAELRQPPADEPERPQTDDTLEGY